jgi:hypothetical protein
MSHRPSLPAWITRVEGFKARYVLDPDQFYPLLLSELGVTQPDQYWLEVAHQIAKLDAQFAIKAAGLFDPSVSLVLIIRGGEGFKDRWALSEHPVGELLTSVLKVTKGDRRRADKMIAAAARQQYKKLRGFLPA